MRPPSLFLASLFVSVLPLVLAACPPETCDDKEALVELGDFALLDAADDPFEPPADALLCTEDNIRKEPFGDIPLAVDIDTTFGCGWATVETASLIDLAPGDRVQVRIFFFSQATFPADEASVIVQIGDELIVDERVPIPTTSGLIAPLVDITGTHPVGTPVRFHVGNHGDNTWNLIELSRVREGACPEAADAGT